VKPFGSGGFVGEDLVASDLSQKCNCHPVTWRFLASLHVPTQVAVESANAESC
jgi:hypothetical protein